MAKTKTFRRGHGRTRRGALLAAVVLLAAGLLALSIYGVIKLSGGTPESDPSPETSETGSRKTEGRTTTVPPTTTTTYPTLSPDATAQLDGALTARNVILYDETHDKILFTRDETARCNPASLTKLMTAAVAAKYATGEDYEIGSEINLRDLQASSAYLRSGMKMTLPQLLEALLLPSGGDAAYSLAVITARRLNPDEQLSNMEAAQRFCDLMNQTAAEIGAVDTHFVNPDGMYHTNHATTAADLLKILRFACSIPEVREAISLPSVSFTTVDGKSLTYTNTNRLLNTRTAYFYQYATGGKTGYTDEAGYCLGATAEKSGVKLMAIVMGCAEENARFTEATALFNAGFALAGV